MLIKTCFFFFQAEYGIRGGHVTGVQTCALPISFVSSCSAIRSRKTRDAAVFGQPSTNESSLMPTGTPPKGSEMSAASADALAELGSRCGNAPRLLRSMAARTDSSSSRGERSPDRNASTREHASPCQGGSAVIATVASRRRRLSALGELAHLRGRVGPD